MEEVISKRKFRARMLTIGISGAVSVALGALGAHALRAQVATGRITQDQLAGFDTAVRYQVYHTLAMLLVVLICLHINNRLLRWAYDFFLTGICFFSGSLYLLCTRGIIGADWLSFLGPVTPLGGLCFVAGWLCLGFSAIKKS
jgi:uncharacterized membrane protein YgdD (TMEM256/DUF423 family)